MNARLSAHLIRPGDLNPGWIALYAVTWALQWFSVPFRYFAALLVLVIVNWIGGWSLPVHYLALIVGFGPLVISLATLVLPLGGGGSNSRWVGDGHRSASATCSSWPSSSCGAPIPTCERHGAGS